jgi:hypothetical protein
MARTKSGAHAPFVKLLALLQDGSIVTKDEIETKLSNDIHVYRLSTYIWDIKTKTDAVVKVVKNGRAVTGYQITNPDVVRAYLTKVGISDFVPGSGNIKQSVSKFATPKVKTLSGLKAKPAKVATIETPVTDEVVEITE